MSAWRIVLAAVAAALVETGCLWAGARALDMSQPLSLALAFVAGYAALGVALHLTRPPGAHRTFVARLSAYGLWALAGFVIMEAVLYLFTDLVGVRLLTANVAALVAVACWAALTRHTLDVDHDHPARVGDGSPQADQPRSTSGD